MSFNFIFLAVIVILMKSETVFVIHKRKKIDPMGLGWLTAEKKILTKTVLRTFQISFFPQAKTPPPPPLLLLLWHWLFATTSA